VSPGPYISIIIDDINDGYVILESITKDLAARFPSYLRSENPSRTSTQRGYRRNGELDLIGSSPKRKHQEDSEVPPPQKRAKHGSPAPLHGDTVKAINESSSSPWTLITIQHAALINGITVQHAAIIIRVTFQRSIVIFFGITVFITVEIVTLDEFVRRANTSIYVIKELDTSIINDSSLVNASIIQLVPHRR
jgi:hypothetical protein